MDERRVSPVLDRETIDFLRGYGKEVHFSEGSFVLRRGELGSVFYVLTSGEVDVRVQAPEGDVMRLNRLGKGCFFGEISLLLSSPVTADVVTAQPATAIMCEKDAFLSALDSSTSFSSKLSQGLASRVAGSTIDMWDLHQERKALNILMGYRRKPEPLFASSRAMGRIESRLEDLTSEPLKAVLLHGAAGTGKTYLSSLIHGGRLGDYSPFIVVDCRSFCGGEAEPILFGTRPSGYDRCRDASGDNLRSFGAVHLAAGGSLVLRHIDVLGMSSQDELFHCLKNQDQRRRGPLQLIATTRKDPEDLKRDGLLHPGLEELLKEHTLAVPELHERRKDILSLAKHFLKRCEGQSVFRFSPGAERKLLSMDYSYGNAVELKEAVETATQISDSIEIRDEHLFVRRVDQEGMAEFDLGRSPFISRLTTPGVLRPLRWLVLATFLAIIGLSIFRGSQMEGQVANALIWSLWEPALFLSFFLLGRVWCTICPLSTAGKLFRKLKRLDHPPPDWLKKDAGYLFVFGFAGIVWAEHYFHMIDNPLPSGILLLGLFTAAVLFAIRYQRETWCRYACPLGGLGAVYATPAMLSVRADSRICSHYCTTHPCYSESGEKSGCPTFRHPLHVTDSHYCKMCLSCLEICPHGASRLYLRPPLVTIWRSGSLGSTVVLFAFFLFFFGPAMVASRGGSWAGTSPGFALTTLAALLLASLFLRGVPDMLSGYSGSREVLLSRVGLALIVLAWGPIMAYQMDSIRGLPEFVLHIREGSNLVILSEELSLLFLVQASFIVQAGIFSAIAFWRVRHEASSFRYTAWDLGWKFLALLCGGYIALNLFLVSLN